LKIIVLGSSGGAPTKKRNCSSFILALEPYGVLFDCAEGTQRQLLQAGYKLSKIKYIFISHLHFDHLAGLVPMLSTKSMFRIAGDVVIAGPKGIREFIEYNLGVTGSKLHFGTEILEITDGAEFRFGDFTVTTHLLNHRIESYGYRLKFNDIPGNIIPEKLKEFGLSEGPVCRQLKSGETVLNGEGKEVTLRNVATDDKPGKTVAFAGDTYLCKGLYACFKDADTAIVESTFLERDRARAEERTHLTASMAGNVCERSGVNNILLYHFSASYTNINEFRIECSEKYRGVINLAEDFKEIEIE